MEEGGPLLQQMESGMKRIVDSDHSKVDVDEMCKGLELEQGSKEKLHDRATDHGV